jgi:hypothetical protein
VGEILTQLPGAVAEANWRFGGDSMGSTMQPQRQRHPSRARLRISVPQRHDDRDLAAALRQPLRFQHPATCLCPFCALAARISDDHCASHILLLVAGAQARRRQLQGMHAWEETVAPEARVRVVRGRRAR